MRRINLCFSRDQLGRRRRFRSRRWSSPFNHGVRIVSSAVRHGLLLFNILEEALSIHCSALELTNSWRAVSDQILAAVPFRLGKLQMCFAGEKFNSLSFLWLWLVLKYDSAEPSRIGPDIKVLWGMVSTSIPHLYTSSRSALGSTQLRI
jgi:hypothetical protein